MAAKTELAIKANKEIGSRAGRSRKSLAAVALSVVAVAGLAGCANPFHHSSAAAAKDAATKTAATPTKSATARKTDTGKTTATEKIDTTCYRQVIWNAQTADSLKALYADIGALQADERADNAPGVKKAGHKLASDAVAAATLALPLVDQKDWMALIAAYATAGTALASGGAVSAVPQLEAGGSAITAFATAVAKCKSA
jgi:hypothetical protein